MNQPTYSDAIALAVGTPIGEFMGPQTDLPVRGVLVNCTVAGNVSLTLSSGAVVIVAVAVGAVILPLSVIEVNSSSTTATATYYALG